MKETNAVPPAHTRAECEDESCRTCRPAHRDERPDPAFACRQPYRKVIASDDDEWLGVGGLRCRCFGSCPGCRVWRIHQYKSKVVQGVWREDSVILWSGRSDDWPAALRSLMRWARRGWSAPLHKPEYIAARDPDGRTVAVVRRAVPPAASCPVPGAVMADAEAAISAMSDALDALETAVLPSGFRPVTRTKLGWATTDDVKQPRRWRSVAVSRTTDDQAFEIMTAAGLTPRRVSGKGGRLVGAVVCKRGDMPPDQWAGLARLFATGRPRTRPADAQTGVSGRFRLREEERIDRNDHGRSLDPPHPLALSELTPGERGGWRSSAGDAGGGAESGSPNRLRSWLATDPPSPPDDLPDRWEHEARGRSVDAMLETLGR